MAGLVAIARLISPDVDVMEGTRSPGVSLSESMRSHSAA